MTDRHGIRRAALTTGLAAVLLVAGCTRDPVAEPPPRPTGTSPPSTLTRVEVGDRLTVTAAVDQIIDDTAIVVRDVDLTEGTLLVLTRRSVDATPPQLVTVEGTIVRFSYRDLATDNRLADPRAYRPFEGQKALTASHVTVWR